MRKTVTLNDSVAFILMQSLQCGDLAPADSPLCSDRCLGFEELFHA